ncbi:MAG: EVE domain-containing protein [Bacteroidetes bacterium]|nr:EVE domain-containing protein [Bacteroidota bacterium]MBU1113994.1 EVE domain-containing protein [Bacteroidota bacterium]MBU1799814.1 EVE domain-containing protein [Bacteroidota bacterium]
MKYWLVKSEPNAYSIDDLARDKITHWDGVRNYQARNFMRDEMKIGDKVLFYHSNTETPAVVGVCEVVKEGYPDFTAFDPEDKHYDPKSKLDQPTWIMVDIKIVDKLARPVTLEEIKNNPKLQNMKLVQRGNRLSVMPIDKKEFDEIIKLCKK